MKDSALVFDLASGDALTYAPAEASPAGATAEVDLTVVFSVGGALPTAADVPAEAQVAVTAAYDEESVAHFYGWAGATGDEGALVWTELTGATPSAEEAASVKAVVDYAAKTVTFTVGNAVLKSAATADEAYTLPLDESNTKDSVSKVSFGGAGSLTGTLAGQYTHSTHTVIWFVGTDKTETTVADGAALVVPDDPTKESTVSTVYTFAGWAETEGGETVTLPATVTEDLTYYAVFTPSARTYLVTFSWHGDSSTATYEYGATPVAPSVPASYVDNGTIYTFTGWFADGADEAFDFATAIEEDLTLTAKWTLNVATVISIADGSQTYYGSLVEAVAAAQSGDTVKLLANAAVTAKVAISDGRAITLDLNGKTVTSTLGTTFQLSSGSLTVEDTAETKGGISVSGEAFRVSGAANEAATDAVLTLSDGVNVTSSGDCCVFVYGKATVNTAATLLSTGVYCTIQGQGNASNSGTVLNVTGGSITHPSETAIYVPQGNETTISGGTITGATGIYQKSGTLNVTGGTITGTGTKADYTYNGNGANATGDAIVVDNCGYPGGAPTTSITGGTIVSQNAKPVASYAYGDGNEALAEIVPATSTAKFSKDEADGLPAFYSLVEEDGTGLYVLAPTEYTITFVADGGTPEPEPLTYTVETASVALPAVTKVGYGFLGWFDGETKVETIDTAAPKNMTLTAKWEEGSFTLTWVVDGASSSSAVKFGDPIVPPADPTKDGFVFAGWDPEVAATMPAADTTYTATWKAAAATVIYLADGVENVRGSYATLAEALVAAGNGDMVRLLDDVAVERTTISKDVTLDLGGKTLTGRLTIDDGTVTVKNGTLAGLFDAYDSAVVTLAADAAVSGQVVVWGDGTYGEDGCKTPTLNVYGSISNTGDAAISCNGTDRSGAVINIYDGASVTSTDDVAIFLPSGNLTVSGGTITGTTGIYQKSGTLVVNGGTITGNGAKADYTYNGNGATATGDAIVVDNCGYPNGTPEATISGGTIISVNAQTVASYAKDDDYTAVDGIIPSTSTARFSDADADGVPEGYALVADGNTGLYMLANNVWTMQMVTAGGTLNEAGTTASYANLTVPYSPIDTANGRAWVGAWVGVNVIAPESVTAANIASVKYDRAGNACQAGLFGGSDARTASSFGANNDGQIDGHYYIGVWVPLSAESVRALIEDKTPVYREYSFYFEDAPDAKQTFRVEVSPENIVLTNPNEVADAEEIKVVDWKERFTVRFLAEDGETVLSSAEYADGTAASDIALPTAPDKAADAGYTYAFDKWTPDVADVSAHADYTATYTPTPIPYTISYELDGGAVEPADANPTEYNVESEAITLVNPTKTGHTFAGWTGTGLDAASAAVTIAKGATGNRSYTATWTVKKYTVTFVDEDGTVLKEATEYDYGTPAADIATPATPTKLADANGVYTFDGWDPELADVTEPVTYKATYKAVPAKATVITVAGTQTYYSDLAAAVAAAKDGDTVKLLADVELDARVEPNPGADATLVIDLDGHKITRNGTSGNGSAFDVKSGAVTIRNGTIECKQDDTDIVKDGVYAITSRSGSDVTLAGLDIIVNSRNGACAYPFEGSTLKIESGTYANVTDEPYDYHKDWTGMAVNQANVATTLITITGGTFSKVNPMLGDDSAAEGAMSFVDAAYYAVSENGAFTVVPRIDIAAATATVSENLVYDGTAQKGVTAVAYGTTNLVEGTDYIVSYASNVNAGTATASLVGTNLYTGTLSATFSIAPKPVTITADGNTKVYDGTALTVETYTSGELATGDTLASVTITGTQTDVGSSDNVPSAAVIRDADNNDVTANYAITYENGTLTITAAKVAVPTAVADLVYDGTEQTGVVAGTGYTLSGNTATAAGSYTATATLAANYEWDADPAAGTKEIAWSIARAPVTVKANDASKKIGDDDPELTATVTGLIGDDTVSYTVARAAGETAGDYVITAAGDAEQGNYAVSYENGTFTIEMTQATLTIVYVKADGSSAAATRTETLDYGAEYAVESPAVAGYTPDKAIVSGTMGSEDVSVTVTYTVTPYQIAYTLNGGANDESNPKTYTVEDADIELADATRAYYDFGGWFETVVGAYETEVKVEKIETALAKDRALAAKWTAHVYTATLDANEGELADGASSTIRYSVESEAAEIALPTATRTGYDFAGWFDGDAEVSALSVAAPADVTLLAKWNPAEVEYVVKHLRQSVDGTTYVEVEADRETLKGLTGSETAAVAKDYEGFTVQDVVQATIAADGSTVVEIRYTRNRYTVIWVADGKTLETDENVAFGATPSYDGETPTKSFANNTLFAFKGWSPSISEVTGDTTYTAQFSETHVVAQIGDAYYETLEAAFAAVPANLTKAETVVMLEDVTLDAPIAIEKKIALNLGDHTLDATISVASEATFSPSNGVVVGSVQVYGGATSAAGYTFFTAGQNLVLRQGEGVSDVVTLLPADGGNAAYNVYLNLNFGKVVGSVRVDDAITESGSVSVLVGVNCRVYSPSGYGLYVGGNVTSAKVQGTVLAGVDEDGVENGSGVGVEVRRGTLLVNGATIEGKGSFAAPEANAVGPTGKGGVAVLVSPYADANVSVTVENRYNGPTSLRGEKAFYEVDTTGGTSSGVTASIVSGTLTGKVETKNLGVLIPGTSTALFSDKDAQGVEEGYCLVESETAGYYKVAARKEIKATMISVAENLTYDGQEQTGVEKIVYTEDGADDVELAAGTDYTVVYANNVDAGTATATVTGVGLYMGEVTVEFAIAKAELTATAKSYEIAYRVPAPAFEIDYGGFVNDETVSTAAGFVTPTASCTYATGDEPGIYEISLSGGSAANYEFTLVAGTLTVGEPDVPVFGKTTSIVVAENKVTLTHEVATEKKYHTYFTCSDLKTQEWVAAEDSRATESLTGDTATVELTATDPVRFYVLGVSDTPVKVGEPLPEKADAGE